MVNARPLARRLLLQVDVRVLILLALLLAAGLTFAQAALPAAPTDCIVLDDFSTAQVGEFPPGWEVRKDGRAGQVIFQLVKREQDEPHGGISGDLRSHHAGT